MAVQSVERAVGILELFGPDRPFLGITEMAELMGLGKTTVHGLVKTLCGLGMLQKDPDSSKYQLGLKLLELGHVSAGNLEVNQKSAGLVQSLAARTGFTCRVGLWSQSSILVVLNALPDVSGSFPSQFGPRIPGYCTGLGKAVLAFLSDDQLNQYLEKVDLVRRTEHTITDPEDLRRELHKTAQRGFAVSNRETLPIQAALGAPLFDRMGRVFGALSLSGGPEQVLGPNQDNLVGNLLQCAGGISRSMGHHPEYHSYKGPA